MTAIMAILALAINRNFFSLYSWECSASEFLLTLTAVVPSSCVYVSFCTTTTTVCRHAALFPFFRGSSILGSSTALAGGSVVKLFLLLSISKLRCSICRKVKCCASDSFSLFGDAGLAAAADATATDAIVNGTETIWTRKVKSQVEHTHTHTELRQDFDDCLLPLSSKCVCVLSLSPAPVLSGRVDFFFFGWWLLLSAFLKVLLLLLLPIGFTSTDFFFFFLTVCVCVCALNWPIDFHCRLRCWCCPCRSTQHNFAYFLPTFFLSTIANWANLTFA